MNNEVPTRLPYLTVERVLQNQRSSDRSRRIGVATRSASQNTEALDKGARTYPRQREQAGRREAGMDGGNSCGGDVARKNGIPS